MALDLIKILKGHEGEKFYYTVLGKYIELEEVGTSVIFLKDITLSDKILNKEGALYEGGETLLFPSDVERDWLRWDIDHNYHDTPKIWDDLMASGLSSPVSEQGKSVAAYSKILQLLKHGYGGIVTKEDWRKRTTKYIIAWNYTDNKPLIIISMNHSYTPLSFFHDRWADEFINHPENIELLKDYFMV